MIRRKAKTAAIALGACLALAMTVGAETAEAGFVQAISDEAETAAEDPRTPILVYRVRITIEEKTYDWTEGAPPIKEAGTFTTPATVASFLGFAPGESMRPASLETRCSAAQDRLLRSGLFFGASVDIIPPQTHPERRTVLVTVREGFVWRFGGGSLFAMIGRANLGGERKSWMAMVGYNYDGFSWRDELAFGLPLEFGADLLFSHNLGEGFVDSLKYSASLKAGWRFHPDFLVSATAEAAWYDYRDGSELGSFAGTEDGLYGSAGAGFRWDSYRSRDFWSLRAIADNGAALAFSSGAASGQASSFPLVEGRNSVAYGIGKFEVAAQAAYGHAFSGGAPVAYAQLWDLYSSSGLAVRSGWRRLDLQADSFGSASAELRLNIWKIAFSPIISLKIAPFAFTDAARLSRSGSGYGYYDAFGAGIRLGLDNPVFAYFTFAYGWNREGAGRFTMAGRAEF